MVQVVDLAAYNVGHLSRSFLILYADGLVRSSSIPLSLPYHLPFHVPLTRNDRQNDFCADGRIVLRLFKQLYWVGRQKYAEEKFETSR